MVFQNCSGVVFCMLESSLICFPCGMLPLTLRSPLLVPAGKESTSFHLLSEVGNGLFLPKRDGLDCSPLWTKCCAVGGLVVTGGVCPTV